MPQSSSTSLRVNAIDWLRAVTMLLMLFVNDISDVKDIPHWLHHAKATEDFLGFSDVIFPCFLFCVGLSIPFAVDSRMRQGENRWQVFLHALLRTISLVVLGVFTMNMEASGTLRQSAVMVVGAFLLWLEYPRTASWRRLSVAMRLLGAGLLVFLVVWRDMLGVGTERGWWGILGLIGWSYGLCMFLYLAFHRMEKVIVLWGVVMLLAVVSHSSLIPEGWSLHSVMLSWVPSDWTLHAFCFTGVLTAVLLRRAMSAGRQRQFPAWLVVGGMASAMVGMVCHQYWIISKIHATPTWLFFCLALFLPVLAFLIYVVDVRASVRVGGLLKPAATATLTCYLVPYLWYPLRGAIDWQLPAWCYAGMSGLINSMVYALLILAVVRIAGVRLKL